jgi:hypothetical protein
VPEATHWFEVEGEIVCEAHYETSVLWSKTLIQNDSDPMPTLSNDLEPSIEINVARQEMDAEAFPRSR